MNPWRWVDPRVTLVRLAGVRAYLEGQGWSQVAEANPRFVRFAAPEVTHGNGPPFFVVPASDQFADFTRSITDFITVLSEVEDRHPVAVLEDLLQSQERVAASGALSAG